MAAPVDISGDSIQTGKPVQLFTGAFRGGLGGLSISGNTFADYDVSPDGQHFVMFPATEAESTNRGVPSTKLVASAKRAGLPTGWLPRLELVASPKRADLSTRHTRDTPTVRLCSGASSFPNVHPVS